MRGVKLIVAIALICSITAVQGQTVLKDAKEQRNPIPYPHLREADVMWSKQIWRTIDLREKFNHALYYPLEPKVEYQSLFDVIMMGIDEGTITAYDPIDDEFRYPMSKKDVYSILTDTTIEVMDGDWGEEGFDDSLMIVEEITAQDICRYEIKEE